MTRRVLLLGLLVTGIAGGAGRLAPALEKEPSQLFWDLLDKAEWGETEAQYAVGMMYLEGEDVERDSQEAARWLREAAEQGHAHAQFKLGEMYEQGEGVEKNAELAAYWYRKAATEGGVQRDDAGYYADLREIQLEQMRQEHELEMLEKQQAHELKLQRQRQRHQDKMYRRSYRDHGSIRHHRYY